MKQTLYFIRHGHTEGTTKGVMYGWTELHLTEPGREEIVDFSRQGIYPDCSDAQVYTSGMIRTEQTLEAIYGEIEHDVKTALKEINMGDYEMKPVQELLGKDWGKDWLQGKLPDKPAPNGESQNQFVTRVQSGVRQVIDENIEAGREKIIIVCHGGVIAFAMDGLFPETKEIGWAWTPDPGRGYVVEIEDGEAISYRPL